MSECPKRTDSESGNRPISDGELLGRFVDRDDEDAFAELVSRYHGLVLGICRRTLRDEHSAEDAFQATFLVLARRAARIRDRSSLAGWLYAVAYRTALRANTKRNTRREETLLNEVAANDDVLAQITSRYQQQALDEELSMLPAILRQPLVLRYLMGKSNKQVADELGVTVGVVEGRLKRAKDDLRLRLAKRGISATALLGAVGISTSVLEAATTNWLVDATVQSAVAFRGGSRPVADCSQNAIRLAEKELAVNTSAITAATSSVVAVLAIAGLTFAWAADGAQQSEQTQGLELTATVPADLLDAISAQAGQVPVPLVTSKTEASDDPSQDRLGILALPSLTEIQIHAGDRLYIRVANTLPESPIDGEFRVDNNGNLHLPVAYDTDAGLTVAGLTRRAARDRVLNHLTRIIHTDRRTGFQPVFGEDRLEACPTSVPYE